MFIEKFQYKYLILDFICAKCSSAYLSATARLSHATRIDAVD